MVDGPFKEVAKEADQLGLGTLATKNMVKNPHLFLHKIMENFVGIWNHIPLVNLSLWLVGS